MSYSIGVDLGGTNIKIVVISMDGNVLEYLTCDTADTEGSWAQTIKQNLDVIQQQRGQPPCHIGLAAPGLAASDGHSIAYMQGRLAGLQGFMWQDFLQSPTPVVVLNDANAALLGEAWQGAAQGYSNAILLTLGTGVGGAALVDGRLIKGKIGRAGHLGHVTLDPDGPPDITGTPGSLEAAIGNCTIRERTGGQFDSTLALAAAHGGGDKEASRVWLRSVQA